MNYHDANSPFTESPVPVSDCARQRASDAGTGEGEVEGAPPSNTAPHNYKPTALVKPLLSGIDSLYLSYAGQLADDWDTRLTSLKDSAQSDDIAACALAQVQIGQHLFEVKDRGRGRYAYVLQDNCFHISIGRGTKLPLAYVQISSEFLCHVGVAEAVDRLTFIVNTLGAVRDTPNVSRADLFVDFASGVDMDNWRHDAWVTRAREIKTHYINRKLSGWSIGQGGDISARLYDKLLEIVTKSQKTYLFELWQAAGWLPGETAWRKEFQFRLEALKTLGVSKVPELLANLQGIWRYAAQDWLRLSVPQPSDVNRTRWPNHTLWDALSAVIVGNPDQPKLARFRPCRIPSDDRLFVNGFLGSLSSFMAREGITDVGEGVGEFLAQGKHYLECRSQSKGKTFSRDLLERVALKGNRFNTIKNQRNAHEEAADLAKRVDGYLRAKSGDDE